METSERYKPRYQLWNDEEFLGDQQVKYMTPVQRWMYRTLLQAAFFGSDRPYLPDRDHHLWMIAGCESREQWEQNKKPVKAMFTKTTVDGKKMLSRKRLLSDWEYLLNRREEMREKGSRGGKAKAKRGANPPSAPSRNFLASEVELSRVELSEEGIMSFKQKISGIALRTGIQIHSDDPGWEQLKGLAGVFKPAVVIEAFETWMGSLDEPVQYPLSKFIPVALDLLSGEQPVQKTNEELDKLTVRLYNSTNQTFTGKNRGALGVLLETYTSSELEQSFLEFVKDMDDFKLRRSVDEFCKGGAKLVINARRDREVEQKKQEAFMDEQVTRLKEEAKLEQQAFEEKTRLEESQIEEFLGG